MNIILFGAEETAKPLPRNDARAEHIRKILHKTVGDTFDAGIIGGMHGVATITDMTDGNISFTFTKTAAPVPLYPLVLIVGFPRPIQLKRLLRDVSSLGVAEVHLTGTQNGEKSYLRSTLLERGAATNALTDGAMQAKTTLIPHLFMHESLADCLSAVENTLNEGAVGAPDNSAAFGKNVAYKKGFSAKAVAPSKNAAAFGDTANENTTADKKNASVTESAPVTKPAFEHVKLLFDNVKPVYNVSDMACARAFTGKTVVAAIGSERGWTDAERDTLTRAGYSACSLGSRILRTETATVTAVSLILSGMGAI